MRNFDHVSVGAGTALLTLIRKIPILCQIRAARGHCDPHDRMEHSKPDSGRGSNSLDFAVCIWIFQTDSG